MMPGLTDCVFVLQHNHCLGKGPWEGCFWTHHQAVPFCPRVNRQRQLRHLQRLREDLGGGPEESDRDEECRRPAGGPTGFRKPSRHSAKGRHYHIKNHLNYGWQLINYSMFHVFMSSISCFFLMHSMSIKSMKSYFPGPRNFRKEISSGWEL